MLWKCSHTFVVLQTPPNPSKIQAQVVLIPTYLWNLARKSTHKKYSRSTISEWDIIYCWKYLRTNENRASWQAREKVDLLKVTNTILTFSLVWSCPSHPSKTTQKLVCHEYYICCEVKLVSSRSWWGGGGFILCWWFCGTKCRVDCNARNNKS